MGGLSTQWSHFSSVYEPCLTQALKSTRSCSYKSPVEPRSPSPRTRCPTLGKKLPVRRKEPQFRTPEAASWAYRKTAKTAKTARPSGPSRITVHTLSVFHCNKARSIRIQECEECEFHLIGGVQVTSRRPFVSSSKLMLKPSHIYSYSTSSERFTPFRHP